MKFNFLLDQGVRSDHQMHVAMRDMAAGVAFAVFFKRAGKQHHAIAGLFQRAVRRKIVLRGEDFCRRHKSGLITILNGNDRGLQGHNSFARAHVPLEQPAHGRRMLHVCRNLF